MPRPSRMSVPPSVPECERFRRHCLPHLPALLRTAHCLVASIADAEDLVQDTMLKALEAIRMFKEGTDAKAWLMTILRRTFIDRLRARRRRPVTTTHDSRLLDEITCLPQDSAAIWPCAPDALMERFSDRQIIAALQSLPQAIRWTLLLVDVEGLGQEETARVLQVPVGTVKSRAHRGRLMLRDSLLGTAMRNGWLTKENAATIATDDGDYCPTSSAQVPALC